MPWCHISSRVRANEKMREDREIGRYVAKIVGAKTVPQVTTLKIPHEGGSKIVEEPQELKNELREYTVTELGRGREAWFLEGTETHPLAQFTRLGDETRHQVAHGTMRHLAGWPFRHRKAGPAQSLTTTRETSRSTENTHP